MLRCGGHQVRYDGRGAAAGDLGLRAAGEHGQTLLLQCGGEEFGELEAAQVVEHRAAELGEGGAEFGCGLGEPVIGGAGEAAAFVRVEPAEVDGVVGDHEAVSGRGGGEHTARVETRGAQRLAQVVHEHLQVGARVGRRIVVPRPHREGVRRHHSVGLDRQLREHRSGPRAAEW